MTSPPHLLGIRGRAGYSMVELIATLVIMGVLLSLAAPVMTKMLDGFRTKTALDQVATDVAYTRSLAIKNGRSASFRVTGNGTYLLTVDTSSTSADATAQKSIRTVNLTSDTRATITATSAVVTFDSRGFGRTAPDTLIVARGSRVDTLYIETLGRIRRGN